MGRKDKGMMWMLNKLVTFQYFLLELQGALENGYFLIAAISEGIRQCFNVFRKEILLDMAVQNIVGD